jgi:DNA polymerase III delta prime subunit
MANLSTLEKPKAVHAMLYGPPKSGKTRLAGQLASEGFKLFWFDLENGSTTLFGSLDPESKKNVEVYRIPDLKTYPIAIETCLKVIEFRKVPYRICDNHGKMDCPLCTKEHKPISILDYSTFDDKSILVFDSLTQLSNSAMNHVMKGKGDELTTPEWPEFRAQGTLLDKFLGNIQNSPYHVVVISHEQDVKMNDGKEKLVPVAGTRNFSRNTAKYFDEVIYMDIFNKRHRASSSTTAITDVLTGSRTGAKLEDEKEPSLSYLFTGKLKTGDQQAKEILEGVAKK